MPPLYFSLSLCQLSVPFSLTVKVIPVHGRGTLLQESGLCSHFESITIRVRRIVGVGLGRMKWGEKTHIDISWEDSYQLTIYCGYLGWVSNQKAVYFLRVMKNKSLKVSGLSVDLRRIIVS